jgi:hypothetical protein
MALAASYLNQQEREETAARDSPMRERAEQAVSDSPTGKTHPASPRARSTGIVAKGRATFPTAAL